MALSKCAYNGDFTQPILQQMAEHGTYHNDTPQMSYTISISGNEENTMKQDKDMSDYDVAENAFKDNEIHRVYVQMANFFETFIPQMANDGLNYEDRVSMYVEPLLILCAQFSEAIRKYVNKAQGEENAYNVLTQKQSEVESKAIQTLLPLLLAYIKQTRLDGFTTEMWESLTNLIAQTTKKWDANPEKIKRLVDLQRYNADPEFHKNNLKALQHGFAKEPLARSKASVSVADQVRSRISTILEKNPRATLQAQTKNATVQGVATTKHPPIPFSRSKAKEKSQPAILTPDQSIHTIVKAFAKGDHIKNLIKGEALKNAIEMVTKNPSYLDMVRKVNDFHNYEAGNTTKKDAPEKPDKTTRALVVYIERISQCLEKDDVSSLKKSQIKRCINNMKNNPALMEQLANLGEPKSDTRSRTMAN